MWTWSTMTATIFSSFADCEPEEAPAKQEQTLTKQPVDLRSSHLVLHFVHLSVAIPQYHIPRTHRVIAYRTRHHTSILLAMDSIRLPITSTVLHESALSNTHLV